MGSEWPTRVGAARALQIHGLGDQAAPRLSELLWGIDYRSVFPAQLNDGVIVDVATPDDMLGFVRQHYGTIFGQPEDSPFWRGDDAGARERYLRHACDAFLFWDAGEAVGLFVGNPIDWATYYMRSTAFVRQYQGRMLCQRFLSAFCPVLARAGVARIETETAPSNLQAIAALARNRFVASGTVLSERWGALTRFTRHLDPAAEDVYLRQFCTSGAVHRSQNRRAGDS